MAFGYRKRSPGSGGARPGAGRRPDIDLAMRYHLGEFCEATYKSVCATYHYKKWFYDLVELWSALELNERRRRQFYDDILRQYDLSFPERQIVLDFAIYPANLYLSEDDLAFEIEKELPLLEIIAASVYGLVVSSQTKAVPPLMKPSPLPKASPLPRGEIAEVKREIVSLARDHALDEYQVCDLSYTFILTCWNYHRMWIT